MLQSIYQLLITVMASLFALISPFNSQSSTPSFQRVVDKETRFIIETADRVSLITNDQQEQIYTLNLTQVETLRGILRNDSSYIFNATKQTMFVPTYTYRFEKNGKTAVVSISQHAKKIEFSHEQFAARLDCDPSFDSLIELTQEILNTEAL